MPHGSTRKAAAGLAARLQDARTRAHPWPLVGSLETYCRNSECPVREVTLIVKEHDGKTPDHLTCPACKKPLAVHHVQTLEEVEVDAEQNSRWSVDDQMYRRDHALPDGCTLILLDDRLPPTPPGWWEARQ